MSTIWHILGKDLRRQRVLLALLLGIIALKGCMVLAASQHAGFAFKPTLLNGFAGGYEIASWLTEQQADGVPDHQSGAYFIKNSIVIVIWLAEFPLVLALVAAVLRDDSCLRERAFWRTRPAAPGQMLAAKGLFILGAGFLTPAALQILSWALSAPGAPPGPLLGQFATIQGGVLALAVLLGVLWRNPLVGLITLGLLALAAAPALDALYPDYFHHGTGEMKQLIFHIRWLAYGWLLGVAVASLWAGYCLRRRTIGFVALGAALLALSLLAHAVKSSLSGDYF